VFILVVAAIVEILGSSGDVQYHVLAVPVVVYRVVFVGVGTLSKGKRTLIDIVMLVRWEQI
jgi:hypothetical protein